MKTIFSYDESGYKGKYEFVKKSGLMRRNGFDARKNK